MLTPAVLANTASYEAPPEAVVTPVAIDRLIHEASITYGVPEPLIQHIVKNESSYYPEAIGDKNYVCNRTGQVSPSYGLVQINLCWHDVTIEQAFNPGFAINFLAKNLADGKCYLWSTCPTEYRK